MMRLRKRKFLFVHDQINACFFDGNPKLNPDDLTEVDTDISSLLQFHGYAETVKDC